MYPLAGHILRLASASLLILLYLVMGYKLLISGIKSNFQLALDEINYFTAAISLILLLANILLFGNDSTVGVIGGSSLCICLAPNLSNRYIYGIRESDYFMKQIRILLLLSLTIAVLLSGRNILVQ
jgi:hypothetical protein